jgi:hypothetical protein
MQRELAIALCGAAASHYVLHAGDLIRRCLGKEVIHVSLSPVRGFSEGVDHLERELGRGARLTLVQGD